MDFLPTWTDLRIFTPEWILIFTAMAVLAAALAEGKRHSLWPGLVAFVGTCLAALSLLVMGGFLARSDVGAWGGMPGNFYFGQLLVMDPFGWLFKLLLLFFTLIVIAMWMLKHGHALARAVPLAQTDETPIFFVLLLAATTGLMLLASTTNLLMIFVALELSSLPSYVLAGFRKRHRNAAEGSLKYVLFGAVSAAVMLYGTTFLYGATGSLELGEIARRLHAAGPGLQLAAVMGLLGLFVGAGFKIAAVPTHFWCPDAFDGADFDVAAFLSVASKAAGLVLLLRILLAMLQPGSPAELHIAPALAAAVMALGVVTCFWGNLAAFGQQSIKRLLAYSSIAHAGYMLIGLALIVRPGDAIREPAAEMLLFYLFGYIVMNGGAFLVAAIIDRITGNRTVNSYAGLSHRAPILAVGMTIFLLSLTGIPLTIGFGVKLKLLAMLYQAHTPLTSYLGVPVVALNTVIAAFYYFRIIREMYFAPATTAAPIGVGPGPVGIGSLALLAFLMAANVGLFLGYGWVDQQARAFAQVHVAEAPPGIHIAAATPPLSLTPPLARLTPSPNSLK